MIMELSWLLVFVGLTKSAWFVLYVSWFRFIELYLVVCFISYLLCFGQYQSND